MANTGSEEPSTINERQGSEPPSRGPDSRYLRDVRVLAPLWPLAVVAGCGRLGFDATSTPADDAAPDASIIDPSTLGAFGPARKVSPLVVPPDQEQEASFSVDRLSLYFRYSDGFLYRSVRATLTSPWQPPTQLTELDEASYEYSPAIGPDDHTILFTSDRPGGPGVTDIWIARRTDATQPFGPPEPLPEINSPQSEHTAGISADGEWLTFTSNRDGAGHELYISRRASPTTWSPPQKLSELSVMEEGAGRLFAGGRGIIFHSLRPGGSGMWDLYQATRESTDDPFSNITELASINSNEIDWDPWVTEDGRYIVFGSSRDGQQGLYEAER